MNLSNSFLFYLLLPILYGNCGGVGGQDMHTWQYTPYFHSSIPKIFIVLPPLQLKVSRVRMTINKVWRKFFPPVLSLQWYFNFTTTKYYLHLWLGEKKIRVRFPQNSSCTPQYFRDLTRPLSYFFSYCSAALSSLSFLEDDGHIQSLSSYFWLDFIFLLKQSPGYAETLTYLRMASLWCPRNKLTKFIVWRDRLEVCKDLHWKIKRWGNLILQYHNWTTWGCWTLKWQEWLPVPLALNLQSTFVWQLPYNTALWLCCSRPKRDQ